MIDGLKKSLAQNNSFLELLLNTIPSPVFYRDIEGVYQHCNDAFSKIILGISKEEIIGKSLFDIPKYIPNELAKIYKQKDDELLNNPGTQVYEGKVQCSDKIIRSFYFYKATLQDENDKTIGLVGVMLDVSELKEKENVLHEKNKLLNEMSERDPLTNLFNRRKFNKVFPEMLKRADRYNQHLNFGILDIDDFKFYNDKYGHLNGDKILKYVAITLQNELLRLDDYVFRLGGEEFGILYLSNSDNDAKDFAEKIVKKIEYINHTYHDILNVITVSLGLVNIQNNFMSVDEIYHAADMLMYEAKKSGKNRSVCNNI